MKARREKHFGDLEPHEEAPLLRTEKVEVKRIKEAMDQVDWLGTPAGEAEYHWVMEHPAEARGMLKDGSYFFFPDYVGEGNLVACVYWSTGKFWPTVRSRRFWSPRDDRLVFVDVA